MDYGINQIFIDLCQQNYKIHILMSSAYKLINFSTSNMQEDYIVHCYFAFHVWSLHFFSFLCFIMGIISILQNYIWTSLFYMPVFQTCNSEWNLLFFSFLGASSPFFRVTRREAAVTKVSRRRSSLWFLSQSNTYVSFSLKGRVNQANLIL